MNELERKIAAARSELEAKMARLRELVPEDGGALEGEAYSEYKTLHDAAVAQRDAIEQLVEQKSSRQALDDMDRFLNEPAGSTVPVGAAANAVANGDSEGKSILSGLGWEVKQGIIHAPTSDGELYPMWPEAVLFGDTKQLAEMYGETMSSEAREFIRGTRAVFADGYKSAYNRYLVEAHRLGFAGSDPSGAIAMLSEDERKALSEGVDSAGGFLVPPDSQSEMLSRTAARSVMLSIVRVVPTVRDVVTWPRLQPNATNGSIYTSGFVGGWVGETPAFSDTDPAFGEFTINIRKARVGTKLSNDFISDTPVGILPFLINDGSVNLALVVDNGLLNGDGGSLQPFGLLSDGGITTVDVEGSTTDTISNTTTATGSAPKIIDLEYALPEQYLPNAQWLMLRAIEGKVRKLVDGNGNYLWGGVNLQGGPRGELEGYPLNRSAFSPNDGTNANKVITFGDFSAYIAAQRAQVSARVLNERFADTEQTGVLLITRIGGNVWNPDAFRFGIV